LALALIGPGALRRFFRPLRPSSLSLFRLFYFQLSAPPQPDALSHPLLTHAATSIVNATPQPLAPSSSPAVPIASPNTAGRHSSPPRSVSLAVTRLPLLSRHSRRLDQPSFIRRSERSKPFKDLCPSAGVGMVERDGEPRRERPYDAPTPLCAKSAADHTYSVSR